MSSSVAPATRPQAISALIDSVECYNPDNVSVFENYVAAQCKEGHYDLLANLALLKLYQFNPASSKEDVIINILAKALTAVPAPDFNLCMFLLTGFTKNPSVQKMVTLQQLIEQSRYEQFWAAYQENKALVSAVVGFEDAMRELIAKVVLMSYQAIAVPVLQSYLALQGDAFKQFCQKQQWDIKDANTVIIPINKDNEAKTVLVRENIKFEQLTKVIGHSNEL